MRRCTADFIAWMKRKHGITVNFHGEAPATAGITQEYWTVWREAWKRSRQVKQAAPIVKE